MSGQNEEKTNSFSFTLNTQYSCLILVLFLALFKEKSFNTFNLFTDSDCESGVQLYFTTAPTFSECMIEICMISQGCFLLSIILDAKHKKIIRNNQDFFLFIFKSFKLQNAETFGWKWKKISWLFPTIFSCNTACTNLLVNIVYSNSATGPWLIDSWFSVKLSCPSPDYLWMFPNSVCLQYRRINGCLQNCAGRVGWAACRDFAGSNWWTYLALNFT